MEEATRDLLSTLVDHVLVLRAGCVSFASPTLLELLELDPSVVIGEPVGVLLSLEDQRMSPAEVRSFLSGKVRGPRRLRFRKERGGRVPLLARAARKGSETVLVLQDVSEVERLEAQVRIADRMASVGTLAAGVAHEINNPLAYLLANLHFVRNELEELSRTVPASHGIEELLGALGDAFSGAQRVERIVASLKSFSRGDRDDPQPIEVSRALDMAVDLSANEVRHRARLVRDYGPCPRIVADEARLAQVFMNLLLNAAQALPPGRADVEQIRLSCRTDPRGWAVVEVEDTGPGVPAGIVHRIFDPFFTTKEVGEGSGLGLSICHGVVTALGGTIEVERRADRTVFKVCLPPEPEDTTEDSADADPRPLLLVIDDDPLVGHSLRRLLNRMFQVEVVTDPRKARDRIRSLAMVRMPDLILLDVMMPELSGMHIYESLDPHEQERILFMTGGAFSPGSRRFLATVDRPVIEKPFDPGTLSTYLHSQLLLSAKNTES